MIVWENVYHSRLHSFLFWSSAFSFLYSALRHRLSASIDRTLTENVWNCFVFKSVLPGVVVKLCKFIFQLKNVDWIGPTVPVRKLINIIRLNEAKSFLVPHTAVYFSALVVKIGNSAAPVLKKVTRSSSFRRLQKKKKKKEKKNAGSLDIQALT